MAIKTLDQIRAPFEVKAAETSEGKQIVRGLASTWDIDLGNDVIHKGAFARTISHWKSAKRQKPIPFVDQHRYDSVTRIIGKMTEAVETADGLDVAFEMASHQHAQDVFNLIKDGMVTGLSIGYDPVKWEMEKADGKQPWELTRHLTEVKLMEISAVIWPMNDQARIDTAAVKSLIDAAKTRELTSDELRELNELAIDITALLTKRAPAPEPKVEALPAGPDVSGLATPEQIRDAIHALTVLKLRRPATRELSDSARAVDPNNPRIEEDSHVSTGKEKGAAELPAA